MNESSVVISTPDGTCEAAFFHPAENRHPAILLWPDAGNLRPVMENMARHLAAENYAVLVPNVFYRTTKAPGIDFTDFDFTSPADRERLGKLTGPVTEPGAAERDSNAFFQWLDTQPAVDTGKPAGVFGYCLGGQLALRTAPAVPNRIRAAASFHGGGLVSDSPASPHRHASQVRGAIYIGVAANDDEKQPEAKDILRQAYESAGVECGVEVYPGCLHGWCVPDMPPLKDGKPIYNPDAAAHAWTKLMNLLAKSLQD